MAAAVASRGRPSDAEPLVRRALELNPKLVQGWRNLALVLTDQGRADEARSVLEEAVHHTGPQAAYTNTTTLPPFGGPTAPAADARPQ